ncbi:hypothetical protein J7E99_14055 [Streptomyces sp. ISL-44]|uniref:hypothetical protein n=1 Tax=Streptomyces sp. ISL-44 TaxID=2819184 RepID=UPI001BE6F3BB|nr:hypothetical protein [Streptomyces sp. ISL-44]MBT2541798.1 hypothetical protein [Streptomyces sp. ISL-44]
MTQAQLLDAPTPNTTTPAPPARGRAARRKADSRQARKRSLAARYLGYVGYFVGAGLISGAVVHHPLDPARYTRIALYGVLVFLAATVINEFLLTRERPGWARTLVVIGSSLLLSFGIGMLSGGLQHFDDFPARGAVLVPAGLVVSFIAYVIKDADIPTRRIFSLVGLAVLMVAALGYFGLRQVAASMESTPGGGHSHGTAGEPAADDHAPAATPSAVTTPTQGAAPGAKPDPQTPAHNDGHTH